VTTPEQQPQVAVVTIDQSTIYNLLLEVRDDVRDVKKDLTELKNDSVDHEGRIRSLEKKVWGAAGIGVAGGAALAEVMTRFFGGG